MGRLDGPINAQVQLSITFDGAAQFYLHFKGVTNCATDGIRSVEKHRVVDAAAEMIHHGTHGGHPSASNEGRVGTSGHRTSADAVARRSPGARRRPAQNGQKGIGTILSYFVFVHAIDPIMGPGSQKLDRIGPNGYMVVRLRVSCWHDAGSCRLQRVARKLF